MRRIDPALLADVPPDDLATALRHWTWRIGDDWSPLLMSAVGDLFLVGSGGEVVRLDTGAGALELVAGSIDEFYSLCTDPEKIDEWFLAGVLTKLQQRGMPIGPGECYGFTVLPIFEGGSYDAENRFALSALEHIAFTADMHHQLCDVADGEHVEVVVR